MFAHPESKPSPVSILLREPNVSTFLLVTEDNRVHLMVPFIGGMTIATDNTCQTMTALTTFLGRNPRSPSAKTELLKYKEALEYDLKQPLPPELRDAKQHRLEQINELINNLDIFLSLPSIRNIPSGLSRDSFPDRFKALMRQKKNLFWVLNRPEGQDGYLNGADYVFSMKREGASNFYNRIIRLGQALRPDMLQGGLEREFKQRCLTAVKGQEALTLEQIQDTMTREASKVYAEICPNGPALTGESAFSFKRCPYAETIDDAYLSSIAGSSELSLEEKIDNLTSLCAAERLTALDPSPFHHLFIGEAIHLEKYSIAIQLFMGMINIYSIAHKMTDKNFARVLEDPTLANQFETQVLGHIRRGMTIEAAIVQYINENGQAFFTRSTTRISDAQRIELNEMFISRYQMVKDSPHFDEFMVLYNAPGQEQTHFSHSGFICTPLEFLAPYFPELNQRFLSIGRERLTDQTKKLNVESRLSYPIARLHSLIQDYKSDPRQQDNLITLLLSKTEGGTYVFEQPQLRSLIGPHVLSMLTTHANQDALIKLNNIVADYQYIHITPEFLDRLYLALISRQSPSVSPPRENAAQIIRKLITINDRSSIQKSSIGGHLAYIPGEALLRLQALAQEQEDKFYLSPLDASKIYSAVERHYPQHKDEMNRLLNTTERGPEKFKFALNILGINIDRLGCGLVIPPKPAGKPNSPEGYILSNLPNETMQSLFRLMSDFDEFQVRKIEGTRTSLMDGSLSNTILHCPDNILQQFRDILRDSRILGTRYLNPYTDTFEIFPSDPEQLTAKHLQIIARNQNTDDEGVIATALYENLLTTHQIAQIRCLVKWTTISTLTGQYHNQILVVEQPTFQWQKNFYNNGSLFFYPDSSDADYQAFQNTTFFACFNQDRPSAVSANFIPVVWDSYPGKLDLDLLENGFYLEFQQFWESSLSFQEKSRFPINLRYFLAGVGSALNNIETAPTDFEKIYEARLKGILKFLNKASTCQIKRLELPFSDWPNTPTTNGLLNDIRAACRRLDIEYAGTGMTAQPAAPVGRFVTAINTCSSAAVMPGEIQTPPPGKRAPLRCQIAEAVPLGGCVVLNNPSIKEVHKPKIQWPNDRMSLDEGRERRFIP